MQNTTKLRPTGDASPDPTRSITAVQIRVLLQTISDVDVDGGRGASMIAAVATGSTRRALVEEDLDRLATYGALHDLPQRMVGAMLDALMAHALVTHGANRALTLTPAGADVLQAEAALEEAAIDAVAAAASAHPEAQPGAASPVDTLDATLALLRHGLSPRRVAAARSLSLRTVCSHLLDLAARGDRVDLSRWVDPELMEAVREAASSWAPGQPLSPVKHALPFEADWNELKLHLALAVMEAR